MKIVIGCGGAVMFLNALLTWFTAVGPDSLLGNILYAVIAAVAGLWALRWWLRPWPGHTESLVLLATANLVIFAACAMVANPVYGAVGALQLVATGGYLTLFHGPRVLAAHVAWSMLAALALCLRMVLADSGDTALALSLVLIMIAALVVVLPALQFCYWLQRTDALSDPLTMLLNRRGLDYYLTGWFASTDPTPLCVMVIDLDRFKSVNDTFGHPTGDRILVQTADSLRAAADRNTLLARSGGEEFVVVARLAPAAARAAAECLCRAIATQPLPDDTHLTASIGVAVEATPTDPNLLLQRADTAMYRAKRLGGNTVLLADPTMNAVS
ncbi:GGDEF domain-containing protein [Nocardia sp. 2]|uniref:GGDEF domain-containing protein n=2 Tax=Nocardia acididurans TaxID=2802282 RepID=A0ABS1M6I6_9NOCA|nr:GGDEF domain-containing protein [Nocardia acididurans]